MYLSGHNIPPTRHVTIFSSLRIEPAAFLLFFIENRAPTHRERAGATERARARERGQERESARARESKRNQKQARARILREFDFPDANTHCDNTRYEYLLLFFLFTPRHDYWTSSSSVTSSSVTSLCVARCTWTGDDDDGGERTQLASWRRMMRLFCFSNFFLHCAISIREGS